MKFQGILSCFKILFEFLSIIFFGVSGVVCFTQSLTLKRFQKEDIFGWECRVLESAAIIYVILFILAFVSCWYTSHLFSPYLSGDDAIFLELWNLLGFDKKKFPLPPPFDEKFQNLKDDDPYSYLEPRKLANKCCQEEMKYNENFVSKLSPNFDLEDIFRNTRDTMNFGSDFLKQDDIGFQTFNTNVHLNDLEGMKQTGNLTNGNCQEILNYSQNFVLKLSPNVDLEKIVIETSKISDIGSDFLKQDDIGLKSYKTE